MARRKKPENESATELRVRQIKEAISNHANRSEKVSWNRKMDNMVGLIAELSPIEQEILSLMAKKIPVLDKVQVLREEMVKECVHPYEHLAIYSDYVECTFCFKKLSIPLEFVTQEEDMDRTCETDGETEKA